MLAQHRPALPPPTYKHAADPPSPYKTLPARTRPSSPHRPTTPRLASRCVKGIAHRLQIGFSCSANLVLTPHGGFSVVHTPPARSRERGFLTFFAKDPSSVQSNTPGVIQ